MLLMLSPAPVIELPGDEVVLDARFVEGMTLHCQLWPGPVVCVLRRGGGAIPEPVRYAVRRLGFDLVLLDRGAPVPPGLLDSAHLVYGAADDMQYLGLAEAMQRRPGRLVFSIEQSLPERLAAASDPRLPLRRRLGAMVWNLRHERRLRAALAAADGLHLNGPGAAAWYGRHNPRALAYLDNRLRQPQMARAADLAARAERLNDGGPLALAAPGPLIAGSGAEDLPALALMLKNRGVRFTLDILGRGPLAARLAEAVRMLDLGDRVRLADPGSFEGGLMPRLRTAADVAVMPRARPEGPAAWVEAMGCGLPIAGYATGAWRRLAQDSGGGWATSARPEALAACLARLDADRPALIAAAGRARAFAAGTTFETVFARRMAHLRAIAGLD